MSSAPMELKGAVVGAMEAAASVLVAAVAEKVGEEAVPVVAEPVPAAAMVQGGLAVVDVCQVAQAAAFVAVLRELTSI
eukprot:CAMPEP_0205897728 /NCGR_PEP_ID=MMETSP1083-20121108/25647_1 /ASSEMBLY_ACC=CAM_ASM_000430 /TAXON_ID=97485 /ORGANISM="Prymnesium parvum, Strain Texoma1" /LENGTH=77 /DNA_ID=CAMNT_0053262897 /DNA_START=480 /DNA_END=714 /DNA_ORIENTATION=-